MTTCLQVHNLVLRRGDRTVINGISLDVARHEIVTVVGPNGCGKSTLLASVAGVLAPVAGQITVDDCDVWGARKAQHAARCKLGYVPENADAPGFLTGGELAALAAAARGVAAPSANIVQHLGLDELARVRLDRMSLGQRRRAVLGAALAGPPSLLVLDEPDNGLDIARLTALTEVLRDFARNGGAVLLASHDHTFALRLGARMLPLPS